MILARFGFHLGHVHGGGGSALAALLFVGCMVLVLVIARPSNGKGDK